MAGSSLSFLLLLLLLPCLVTSVSAQLAGPGLCQQLAARATCEDTSQGCPPGKTPLKNVPIFAPWLCGGWLKICCVEDSSGPATPSPPVFPIDDSQCGLGDPTGKILNGQNTSVCDWPFVVSIRGRTQPNVPLTQSTTQHLCAGVIIGNNWILTHAVCLYVTDRQMWEAPRELLVVAGEYNIDQVDQDPRYTYPRPLEQYLPVSQVFTHPGFASIRYLADLNLSDTMTANGNALALVKLAQPVTDYCASVACLPFSSSMTSTTCDTFDQCVVLGWGFSTRTFQNTDGTLKQGFVKVYKDYVCDFLQTNVFSSGPARFNGSACMSSNTGVEACLGDQGGPVLCYDGNRWAVQGIIPFRLCSDNEVNPYVIDVSAFQDWIIRTIRNNS